MTDWAPLPYHRDVAAILERENPVAFGSLRATVPQDLDQLLLRQTYRVDPAGHADVHAAVQRAADALGVTVPVEIYVDESGQGANAALVYVPDRAVLVLTGGTLNLLDDDELCAVAGHELAHHLLWTADDGRYLATARLLDAAESDARTPSEYLETARRFRLATELYADRGGMQACGSLTTTVSGLVKLATGLTTVDSAAYLRQAAEVDYSVPSAGTTHPETVLRAWALQEWAERGPGADASVAAALGPQLDLGALDVLGQDRLAEITRSLVWLLVAEGAVPQRGGPRPGAAVRRRRRRTARAHGPADHPDRPDADVPRGRAARLRDRRRRRRGRPPACGARARPTGRPGRRAGAAGQGRARPGRARAGQGPGGALMRGLVDRALGRGGLPPDDVLGLLLPMFHTVASLHETGRVAPLRGLAALDQVDDEPVTVDTTLAGPPVRNRAAIAAAEVPGPVEVEAEESTVRIVAGWQRWEHLAGHHDELTDIASLGELFVALVCGLDLADEADAALLQQRRNNLFALAPALHPVLATVASSMIAPDRRRRAQDLADVITRLETYRDQPEDFDLDRVLSDRTDGRAAVLEHLRDRLFDASRRNPLLHFRPTGRTINLTEASVPLVLDVRHIRASQLFTWGGPASARLVDGKAVDVGSLVRWDDAPYAAASLDALISSARRDRAEYGRDQLRLVVAFLRWHDVKNDPATPIESPLVLAPVTLTKQRGVRDAYRLQLTGTQAEVNPVLRHQLDELFGLRLPESIDLAVRRRRRGAARDDREAGARHAAGGRRRARRQATDRAGPAPGAGRAAGVPPTPAVVQPDVRPPAVRVLLPPARVGAARCADLRRPGRAPAGPAVGRAG